MGALARYVQSRLPVKPTEAEVAERIKKEQEEAARRVRAQIEREMQLLDAPADVRTILTRCNVRQLLEEVKRDFVVWQYAKFLPVRPSGFSQRPPEWGYELVDYYGFHNYSMEEDKRMMGRGHAGYSVGRGSWHEGGWQGDRTGEVKNRMGVVTAGVRPDAYTKLGYEYHLTILDYPADRLMKIIGDLLIQGVHSAWILIH